MTTDILHQPTPEFRDYLEGEISREFRHRRSFARLRFAAIALATLVAGTTAGMASAQIRQGAQRDSLLEAAQSELWLTGMRLELAKKMLERATSSVRAGVAGPSAVSEAESEMRQMEALAARATLNVDEVRASALPPRDDLNAPLVGRRDFVSERIQIDLFMAQQRLTAAEQALAERERQARALGTVSEFPVLEAGLKVTRERAALGTLAERRKLRKEFVGQGTPVDQLNRRFRHAQVRFDASVAQESVRILRQRLEALQKLRGVGSASELDVLRAELELREREVELQMLVRQLRELAKPA